MSEALLVFAGSIWGGTRGGDGGGILGVGSIGQGVGMIYGGIAGAIGGAIGAFVIDKTLTYTYTTGFMNSCLVAPSRSNLWDG